MTDINRRLNQRITRELDQQHHGIAWLAEQSGIPEHALTAKMSGATDFTAVEIAQIANALEIGFLEQATAGDRIEWQQLAKLADAAGN